MRRWLLGIVFLTAIANAQDDISLRVTLTPQLIPFHRFATYTVNVEAPATASVRFDDMTEKFGGLQVTSGPEHQTVPLDDDRIRVSETYRIEAIFAGEYFIEPATVTINDQPRTIASPALRVRDLTPEEAKEAERFLGIIDPPPVRPEWYRNWRFWSLALIIAALLIGLLRYLRTRGSAAETAPVPLSPWEVAYQRLRDLDLRQLPKTGKYGAFYVDLSAILRYYIEDRFHVHAPEQTTPEFLAAMRDSGMLDEDHQRFLAYFLRLSDRVKFAQYKPTIEEMDHSFVEVLKFVDDTVPRPQAPLHEEAAA